MLAGAGGLDQPEYLSFTPAQQVLVIATAQPPSVTSTVTDEDVQSTSGLVLDRNAANGAEVTHFKITSITNGTLYQNDGVTVINDGDFITFDEGNAGLRFTPAPDYSGPASFDVEASTTGDDTSLSGVTTASITVNPANDAPELDFAVVPVLGCCCGGCRSAGRRRWAPWFRVSSICAGAGGYSMMRPTSTSGRALASPWLLPDAGGRLLALFDRRRKRLESDSVPWIGTTPGCSRLMPARASTSSRIRSTTARSGRASSSAPGINRLA